MRSVRGDAVQVLVSAPAPGVATRLARALVGPRLAACVQILGPIRSHYRWQGRIESAREWLLLIKTRAALLGAVEAEVRRLHPYTVAEMLVVPVRGGHAPYLDWLRRECRVRPPATRALTARTRRRRGRGSSPGSM